MQAKSEQWELPIENSQTASSPESFWSWNRLKQILAITSLLALVSWCTGFLSRLDTPRVPSAHTSKSFYSQVSPGNPVCGGVDGNAVSHAGFIGLKGDVDEKPKRSFFWYFEAEENPENALIILTIGGGPGSSGMMNPLFGQSSCHIADNGVVENPHRWTEKYNLLALDHPIGVGFSYGKRVNNSRDAADDVYDFLQKFFILFPQLSKNRFVISSGSYGGIYVPNIATVIQEQNQAVSKGQGHPGAVHINLDTLVLSNPLSDPMSHWTWLLHYRCTLHQVYNSTTCAEMYTKLPTCIDSLRDSFANTADRQGRVDALEACSTLNDGDTHGIVVEDIRRTCIPEDPEDPLSCHPEFEWMKSLFNNESTLEAFGIPQNVSFLPFNIDVAMEFGAEGDLLRQHYLLYEPLLAQGIRLLHYVGVEDANCAWPGVISFLKQIKSPFQSDFIEADDLPWPSAEHKLGTVRAIGEGAGNMTFFLLDGAGHFVVGDQPAAAKSIIERWIDNEPWF